MRQACLTRACGAVLSAVLLACADPAVAPEERGAPQTKGNDVGGVARGIALALASPEMRAVVRDAMRESDVNEHKLVLQEFVSTPGGRQLVHAAATALRTSDESFLETVRALPELDFYAPFRKHRLEWRATGDVLVAGTVDPDNRYLDAYSIDGETITLDSEDGVPPVPLLILHPGEKKVHRPLHRSLSGETIEDAGEGGSRGDRAQPLSVGFSPDSVYIDEFGFGPGDQWGDSELRFEAAFRRNSQTIATGRYEQGNVEQGERYDVTAPLIHVSPQPYSTDTLWVELWEDDCCGGDDYHGTVKVVAADRLVEKCYQCVLQTASIIRLDWFVGTNRIPSQVWIAPSPATVAAGGTLQLSYSVADQAGNAMESWQHAAPTWQSMNPAVATVSSTGLVTGGPSEASTTIQITVCPTTSPGSPCKQQTVPVHVQVPIASVVISPNPVNVPAGQWAPVSATARDASGQPIPGVTFTWQTDNHAIATAYGGSVTGVAQGSTVVRATPSGRPGPAGTATVNVSAAPPLQVSIQGHFEVQPYTTCRWWSAISNGVEPYTYRWYVNGSLASESQDLYWTSSASSFEITVDITDGNGASASDSRFITVSSSAGACIEQ